MADHQTRPRQSNRRRGRDSVEFKAYIRPQLHAELAAYAAKTGTSMSLLVDDALEELMSRLRAREVA